MPRTYVQPISGHYTLKKLLSDSLISTLNPRLRGEYRHVREFKGLIDVPDLGVSQIPSEKSARYWDVTGSQLEHSFPSVLIFPGRLMCSLILSPEHRRADTRPVEFNPKSIT